MIKNLSSSTQQGHLDLVQLLLRAGARVNSIDSLGYTPLHWAAGKGHDKIVTVSK